MENFRSQLEKILNFDNQIFNILLNINTIGGFEDDDRLAEFMKNDELVKDIHYTFVKYKYSCIEKLATQHECHKPYSVPKHRTLPTRPTKPRYIHLRKTQSLNYRVKSSSSFGCDFSRSSFSSYSELEIERSISSRADNSYCSEATDIKLLTPAVLCANQPMLVQRQHKDGLTNEEVLLHLNTSKVSEKLNNYVRQLFALSKDDYNEYKAAILSNCDPAKKLQSHLFKQLQILEKDETVYYTKDNFQDIGHYEEWKRVERGNLTKLLNNKGVDLNSLDELSDNWKYDEYKALLLKMIEFDVTNKTRRRHQSLSESNVSINRVTLLGQTANHLLAEFAARYRINDVTCIVTYIECVEECRENDLFELGDLKVLKTTSKLLKDLLRILEVIGNCFTISEQDTIGTCIINLTSDIKRLMCTFLYEWKPNNEQLEASMLLLDSCYELCRRLNYDVMDDYPACVKDWLEKAVRDDYIKHKYLPCDCDPFKNSESASLLRAVVHSINNIQKGSDVEYQKMFGRYVPGVTKVTAEILYNLVVDDVCQLRQNESLQRGTKPHGDDLELEERACFVLASKVAEFEYSVRKADFDPMFMGLSWRRTYHRMTVKWMTSLASMMTKLLSRCIIENKDIPIDDVTQDSHATDKVSLQESTAVLHEQSCFYHKEGDLRESGKERGDLNSMFSSSVLQFCVLLNRFVDFVSQVVESVYSIPRNMDDDTSVLIQKQKDSFCIKVFEIMSNLIEHYCDCATNYDLCLFPKIAKTLVMPEEKLIDLKMKLENRLLPGCRHQFMERCEDKIHNFYSNSGVYADMAKRVNNVVFLSENLNLIWERLLQALDVAIDNSANHSSFPSCSSNVICEDVFVSRPATSTESLASDESQATVIANPTTSRHNTMTSQSTIDDLTVRHDYENVTPLIQNGDVKKRSQNVLIKDANNNSDEASRDSDDVIIVNCDVTRKRSNTAPMLSAAAPPTSGSDCHVTTCSDDEVTRQRSSTLGNSPVVTLTIRDMTLKREMVRAKQSVKDCFVYLSRMLSFRHFTHIRDAQLSVVADPRLPLKITKASQSRDIEKCREHCRPLTSLIEKTVATLSRLLCSGSLRHSYIALWELLIQELKSQVHLLKYQGEFAKPNAFLLFTAFRVILNVITSNGVITTDDVDNDDLQLILTLLELYVTPTNELISLHHKIDQKQRQRNNEWTTSRVRRSIKQKSFTGKELYDKAVSYLGKSKPNVKLEAFEYCTELLKNKQIHFLFLRNINLDKMPTLEECLFPSQESSLEQSWQSRDEGSNLSSDGFVSFPETDSDGGRSWENNNQFMADADHYYRFDIKQDDVGLYKTMDSLQNNVEPVLKDILQTRKGVDSSALEFIRSGNNIWLNLFPCFA